MTINAQDFRYVELAPRPVLPLIKETAQAIEPLQDIKAERKEQISMSLNSNNELSKHHYKTPGVHRRCFAEIL